MENTLVNDAIGLIRLEYLEMPCLKLTFWQAQRLWDLPAEECDAALESLVAAGFLRRTRDGQYLRRSAA
jgi:hypothetical protein